MEVEKSKSRHESREERADNEVSPVREHRDGRRKAKDHRSKDKEKDYDREKNKDKEREREKDHRRDKEKDRDRKRDREGDTEKEISRGRDKEREKEKTRDRVKEKEKEKERDNHKDRENEKEKDKDRSRMKERASKKGHEDDDDTQKAAERYEHYDNRGLNEGDDNVDVTSSGKEASALELQNRILKMREERKKKAEDASDALSWVARSRKIEEKRNAEKQRAQQLSRIFEEQDNLNQGGNEDSEDGGHLSGVKVLHGLEKVVEGGAVILTLKDQSVLADGDVNDEIDMLENVEIGEQKRRNEAYEAAKKKKGIYDDKFNDDPTVEKKMLPQYDEPATDEGILLDAQGRFTGEAEKKLEELRKRIQGQTTNTFEDLNSSAKVTSDYFSHEEMLQFKKPKKKKQLRKKDKLDLNLLEAEAVASGLGAEDLGSRKDGKRQAMKEEKERNEYEKRSNAYQTAIAKADEASRLLRREQVQPIKRDEDESMVLADDAEDLYKSLEKARRLALIKKEEAGSGPQAVAHLVASSTNQTTDDNSTTGDETQENTVVFTEMGDFVWGLQRNEVARKPESEDVFMEEDVAPEAPVEVKEEHPDGWTEVKDTDMVAAEDSSDTKEVTPDETIHEVAVGKGLSGALKLLKDRGTLKEKVDWGGRNMDKKKSKLVGIVDDEGTKESKDKESKDRFKDIRIERTDEFGRTLTPKEAFRLLSHKFHGKGPGKMKEEKRMKQYQEELKLKQMKNSDTPSQSVQRMREAQAQLKTPYLVLSGHVRPGQTSDPQSGFATVEKDVPGSLTPMLGDKKVEHFLGIKRKSEPGNSDTPPKRPKP
ncbi:PREDICTED: SART-1 family protein DOT2 isoform X2 [Camelina sativa]|uniref:SART-1 family protein DOT2 isoform X2 n=1 Tax=Camelina sativa TaxID=90675 RepID=A0ABM1QAQ2_CAMSA|nr:PREDICTED: SART-1 family protein DOT2 isoform X2 [Camelina sativa]